ncbi:MAG TPA: phage terminase large subunit family protein [Anaerohalosphaeraceae bacterium]|nr:phage terminase large subunit family protein [Anaerohalosphaeraceae bacterium]
MKAVWPELDPLLPEEESIWLPPPKPRILEFTRASFILPEKTSRISGPWSDDYVPYQRRPLELLENPPVRVWISACRQSGKSTMASIMLNYILQIDPGPTGIVMPQEGLAKDRVRTKIRPLFQKNKILMQKLQGDIRNLTVGEPNDLGNMILYLGWASSAAALSDRSIQNMIYDEVALFEILESTGENPIMLGRDRQRTFMSIARELGLSSPGDEGDLHDLEMRSGSDEVWYVPCVKPGCGRWHELNTYVDLADEKYIVLSRPAAGKFFDWKDYKRDPSLSRYICPHCGKAWTEKDRWESNQNGVYISRRREIDSEGRLGPPRQEMLPDGTIVGPPAEGPHYSFTWHAMMLYPPFAPVSDLAAEFVQAWEAKDSGDLSRLRTWQRGQRARAWKDIGIEIREEDLSRRILPDLGRRQIPSSAKMLIATADYHMDEMRNIRIDFEIAAYSDEMTNWVIQAGSVSSWDDLEEILFAPFVWQDPTCKQPPLSIARCGVDSGYETDAVYLWCGRYLGWAYPLKGIDTQQGPIEMVDLDKVHQQRLMRRKRRMRSSQIRGLELIKIDQSVFSNLVSRWLSNSPGMPGQTYFYREILQDTEGRYFRELQAMKKVQLRVKNLMRWVWRAEGDVHFHDTRRYNAAVAWSIKPSLLRPAPSPERIPPALINRRPTILKEVCPERHLQTRRPIRRKY